MIPFWKKLGETPLQALNRLRLEQPELATETLSYAGRLDPMAEGVLLVLVGEEENKNREKYLGLEKEYNVSILFGIDTDTHDILGVIKNIKNPLDISQDQILKHTQKYVGTFIQKYPAYSSKLLYKDVPEALPEHEVTIKDLKLENIKTISAQELLMYMTERVGKVIGEFRQDKILESWDHALKKSSQNFTVADFTVVCTAGTYMRMLAYDLGQDLQTGAIALSIVRTRVGGV